MVGAGWAGGLNGGRTVAVAVARAPVGRGSAGGWVEYKRGEGVHRGVLCGLIPVGSRCADPGV